MISLGRSRPIGRLSGWLKTALGNLISEGPPFSVHLTKAWTKEGLSNSRCTETSLSDFSKDMVTVCHLYIYISQRNALGFVLTRVPHQS